MQVDVVSMTDQLVSHINQLYRAEVIRCIEYCSDKDVPSNAQDFAWFGKVKPQNNENFPESFAGCPTCPR